MTKQIGTVQNFTNQQLYTKGFEYNVQAGTANQFTPQLGGKARFLWGIMVFINEQVNWVDPDTMSLVVNSEQIIDKVIWWAYNGQSNTGNVFKERQYFPLPRFLSGADSVELTWSAINAHKINIVFYLSDVNPVTGKQ